jgi:hypothetical protein
MLLVEIPFVRAQFPRVCGLQCPRVSPGAKLPPGSRPVSRMLAAPCRAVRSPRSVSGRSGLALSGRWRREQFRSFKPLT